MSLPTATVRDEEAEVEFVFGGNAPERRDRAARSDAGEREESPKHCPILRECHRGVKLHRPEGHTRRIVATGLFARGRARRRTSDPSRVREPEWMFSRRLAPDGFPIGPVVAEEPLALRLFFDDVLAGLEQVADRRRCRRAGRGRRARRPAAA